MTAPARITQAEIERATKAALNVAGKRARIVLDLRNGRIEIILGESESGAGPGRNEWDDE